MVCLEALRALSLTTQRDPSWCACAGRLYMYPRLEWIGHLSCRYTKPYKWRCVQVREQEVGGVCNQSALLMQQLPEASPFRTLSAAGAFA